MIDTKFSLEIIITWLTISKEEIELLKKCILNKVSYIRNTCLMSKITIYMNCIINSQPVAVQPIRIVSNLDVSYLVLAGS